MQQMLTITKADLDTIHKRLDEIMQTIANRAAPARPKMLLPRAETAETLSISVGQLDKLRRDGTLPAVYVDGNPRWSVEDIERFIAERRGLEPTRQRHARAADKKAEQPPASRMLDNTPI